MGQIVAGFIGVLVLLLGGINVKRRFSSANRDAARDAAESGIFESSLATMAIDRDRWRKLAEQIADTNKILTAENAVFRVELRHARSQMKLQNQLVSRYPDLARQFQTSSPGTFEPSNLPEE